MGGIASLLGRGLEEVGPKIMQGLEKSAAGREINAFAGNQEWELSTTPEGKLIKGYIEETHKAEMGHLSKLDAPRAKLWEGIKADPNLMKQFDYEKATLADIHSHLQSTRNPLAQYSGQLIGQNALTLKNRTIFKNADKTLQQLSFQNNRQASLLAQAQVMGRNMENVSPLIAKLLDSPNSVVRELGQRYSDIIANEFRDREVQIGFSRQGTLKGGESRTKVTMNKAFGMVNKVRRLEGSKEIPLLDTKPTYTDQGVTERAVTDVLRTIQIPLAVFPHSSMELNLAIRAPREALVKALFGMNKLDSDRLIQSSHILAMQDLDALNSDIAAQTGKIAKWTNSPTLGSILNKSFHMPGFNQLRMMQIRHAGAVGFHSANFWAGKLMQGSKMAEAELRAMHINPGDVLKQGGQLTEDQLKSAVYHFTDDTMFLKRGLNMPLAANKNWFTRSMYMYHFFVRNEAFFLQKTLGRMLKNGDLLGVARYVGVLGVLWPAVSPLLESLEILGRTGSPSQATEPEQKMYAPNSFQEWMMNYASTLANIGAIGTFMHYANSVKNYSLLKQVVGPKIATPVTYLQDAGAPAFGKSAKPLARDLLQLIPVAGKPLSHMLEPSQKEQPKYSPHHRGGRRKLR